MTKLNHAKIHDSRFVQPTAQIVDPLFEQLFANGSYQMIFTDNISIEILV